MENKQSIQTNKQKAQQKNISIVIVEDEAIVAADLQFALRQLGYKVNGAFSSGAEAIEEIRHNQPDLILMDIHLTGSKDGIETADVIRKEYDIPVIYLTALADDQTLQRAKITAPFGYVIKPFEIDDLHSTIEMALYKYKLDKKLRESEERYRDLFEYSTIPMMELDLSSLKKFLDTISSRTAEEKLKFIKTHWHDLLKAAREIKINNYNKAMIELTGVHQTEDFYYLIEKNINETSLNEYVRVFENYLEDQAHQEFEISHERIDGSRFHAIMKSAILPGSENNWDKVIYSLYDISERVETESALKHRLEVEQLVSDISTRFVNVSLDNLDEEIERTLGILGEFSNVETCYVRLFESDGMTLGCCYEYCAKNVPPFKHLLTGFSHEPFLWLNERLDKGETIYLADTSQAPEGAAAEKELWKKYKIESILQIPLIMQHHTAGFMGFNRKKSTTPLSQSDINLYRLVADIIANALERKQTEEIYHVLVDHSSIELFILQNDVVIFANKAACQGNKMALDQIKGISFEELVNKIQTDDQEIYRDTYQKVVKGKRRLPTFEIRTTLLNKKTRWLETSIEPIQYLGRPAQQIRQIDISERKTAQQALMQSEARLQALFERAGIGIAICSRAGKIIMANPQLEKLIGCKPGELLKMNFSDITFLDDQYNEIIEDLLSGVSHRSQLEQRFICKDGSIIWGRVTVTLIHYDQKDEKLIVIMVEDITERKTAEEALLKSEERLRLVLEGSRDGFWDWDIISGEVIYSRRWSEMRGFKPEEIESTLLSWEKMIHPKDLPGVRQALQEHLDQHKPQFEYEYRIMTKFGEWKWILDRGVALFDENGIAVRMTGTQTDITERKQMDVALRESEARFRAIYDNSGVGIALTDKRGDILLSNPAFQKMLGYTPAVLQNMTFYDITHPEDVRPNQELTWALHAKKIEGFQLTKRYIRSNGDIVWGHLTVTPVKDDNGKILFVVGMIEDITDQKKAEQALQESEQKLRGLIQQSRDGIMMTDEMGIIIEWNHALEVITKLKARDIIGRPLWEAQRKLQSKSINRKMEHERNIKAIRSALESGKAEWLNKLLDIEIQLDDVEAKCLQTIIYPVKTDKGFLICMIARDITSAKKMEELIRQGKEEWEATVNAISKMIILTDEAGNILRCNRSAENLFPAQKSLVGENIDQLFRSLSDRQATSPPAGECYFSELERWFHITSYPLGMGDIAAGRVYVIKDITNDKEMEAALTASQKLSSLGTLVAGLAHEMNSPLQVITSTSESLLKELQNGETLEKEHLQNYLDMIHRNAWRNAEIVRSLRLYASSSAEDIEENDINDLINDALLLLQNKLGSESNFKVQTHLDADLPPLPCNRYKISQVLINLLINAIDAMPQGGSITITTRIDHEADNILLQIQDSGSGIPNDIQMKVFDPFFTTKPVGSGLGLGLSTVLGIVKGMGGEIGLESTPDKGSIFTLYLPTKAPTVQQHNDIEPELGRYDESVILKK